ncbi:MAG: metabolite traffic protein EboE [Sediminicola sp.]
MFVKDQYHLSYCTNIHPGENWEATFNSIKTYVPYIKNEVSPDRPFGIGLRLSNNASRELASGANMEIFKSWLAEKDCYVFTMNGFPYGDFHGTVVKDKVHAPDWTGRERVEYTIRLFQQLEALLAPGMDGGISTSPVSYRHWFATEQATDEALTIGARHLVEVAAFLHEREQASGSYMHLDMEPEPDGLLENTKEFIDFFEDYVLPVGTAWLKENCQMETDLAVHVLKRHLTMCYDVCHFSLAYESPEQTFPALAEKGLLVGKVQISAALKIIFEAGREDRIWESLQMFNEPTYLHQVTEKINGKVKVYNDLPVVLEGNRQHTELRAHFHVPIFLDRFNDLYSTQEQILETLAYLRNHPVSAHLEVETYTWGVLPADLKMDLGKSIVRELNWVKDHL